MLCAYSLQAPSWPESVRLKASGEQDVTSLATRRELKPMPENVLGPGPVLVPVISGPDDLSRSRSRLNFGPGTGSKFCSVAGLLEYSY